MTTPVNPEGQTAREKFESELQDKLHVVTCRLPEYGKGEAMRHAAQALTFMYELGQKHALLPAQPSEGQTPQEPKAEWRVLGSEGERTAWICTHDGDEVAEVYGNAAHLETAYQRAVAICAAHNGRALVSTPSPAKQTEQKIASAEGAALKSGAAPVTRTFHEDGCRCFRCYARPPDARDAEIARLKALVAEQKDAIEDAQKWSRAHEEDAARLTKELEEARAAARKFYLADGSCLDLDPAEVIARRKAAATEARDLREALTTARENLVHAAIQFASHYGEEDNTQRMRGAIAVLDHALAATKPKPETTAEKPRTECGAIGVCFRPPGHGRFHVFEERPAPAETAGQKERLKPAACRATVDFDPLEMCEPIECGNPMPCALHPAQPSQDVAGTSGESLAGLSKEKT